MTFTKKIILIFVVFLVASCSNYKKVSQINKELISNIIEKKQFWYCSQKTSYKPTSFPNSKYKPHELLLELNKYAGTLIDSLESSPCVELQFTDLEKINKWLIENKKGNQEVLSISKKDYDSIRSKYEEEEINRLLNVK